VLEPTQSVSKGMRKKPADMVNIVEDLYRLLENLEKGYRNGRHPDPKTAKPTAMLLRALADELEL
jgi:cold shock protein